MQSTEPRSTSPVRVIAQESPGLTVANLTFGVGQRDEPAHLAGITHLCEHLVMTMAARHTLFTNAETGVSTVAFVVTGTPDDAVDFLGSLAHAIESIQAVTVQQVELERRILDAEDHLRFHDGVPSTATIRFGRRGFGLMGAGNPTLWSISREEVVDWVQKWFTAENAILSISGERIPSIEVSLPVGAPRAPRAEDVQVVETPVLVPLPHPGVVVSLLVGEGSVIDLDLAVSHELMQILRLDRGLCYSVDSHVNRVCADRYSLDFVIDPVPDHVGDLVLAVIQTLQSLAAKGFSADAVEKIHRSARMTSLDPEARAHAVLGAQIEQHLLGYPARDLEQELRHAGSVDAIALRDAMQEVLHTLIVSFDQDADLSDVARETGIRVDSGEPLDRLSEGDLRRSARRHRRWREKGLAGLAGSTAVVADGELLLGDPRGAWRIDLAHAAVVLCTPDELVTVLSGDGRQAHLRAADWRQGRTLLRSVVAQADPQRVRQLPPEPKR